jgi:CO/xanthine dehydrogenase FAD-binding subunit
MYISDFKYFKPKTPAEASDIFLESKFGVLLAGGTDLLVEIKSGLRKPDVIISLSKIPEMKIISEDTGNVYIGAGVTHNELIKSFLIKNRLPALSEAASKIGSHQIRNIATVGGNLCTGASCADTAPILIAYNADIELITSKSRRIVPLKEFFIFHHKTNIQKGEILLRIIIPKKHINTGSCFEKFGLREASSISVASSAVVMEFDSGICSNINIVIGACSPTPIISYKANQIIYGKSIKELKDSPEIIESAGNAASEDSIPIDDIRGSAEYRRHLINVLTRNAITKAVNRFELNN